MNNTTLRVLLVSPRIPPVGGMPTFTESILNESTKNQNIEIMNVDTAVRWRKVWHTALVYRFIGGAMQSMRNILLSFIKILFNSPQVLHICSTAGPGLLRDIIIIMLAKSMRIPTIIQFHTGRLPFDKQDNGWNWRLACITVKLVSSVAVFTKLEMAMLKNISPRKNILIIPNLIDLNQIDQIIGTNK